MSLGDRNSIQPVNIENATSTHFLEQRTDISYKGFGFVYLLVCLQLNTKREYKKYLSIIYKIK